MQCAQRLFGIRTSLADEFDVGNAPVGPIFNSEGGEREAVVHRGPGLTHAQRLIVRWNQHDFVECQRGACGIPRIEMTDMNGIECATEYAQPPTLHAAGTGSSRTAAI